MKLLIVCSTEFELGRFCHENCTLERKNFYRVKDNFDVGVLITGIGMVNMSIQLSAFLSTHQVEQCINLGFCGSFTQQFALGTVLKISKDALPELGYSSENDSMISFFDALQNQDLLHHLPDEEISPKMEAYFDGEPPIQTAKGITVSLCTNSAQRAKYMIERFQAQTESMEGAAFYSACNALAIPCAQIRSVSNLIPGRAPERWNTTLAREQLLLFLQKIIS